jgi:hypothetical protein
MTRAFEILTESRPERDNFQIELKCRLSATKHFILRSKAAQVLRSGSAGVKSDLNKEQESV